MNSIRRSPCLNVTASMCLAGMALALAGSPVSLQAQLLLGNTSQGLGVSYSGRATVIRLTNVHNYPSPVVICDTGPLPASGGYLEASVSETNLNNGALTLELAHAVTSGDGPETRSATSMNEFKIDIMAVDGTISTLRADFVGSEADASCAPNGKVTLSAGVTIDGLVLNGRAIKVTQKPNQVVYFPGGKLIINEQTESRSGNSGEITVVAMHILVDGCLDGVIGCARAGITCGGVPPPPTDCGKLTGGGWIITPSGYKGSFGVSGGIRRGAFWGHLNYIDHSNGMHVKSTAVTGFTMDLSDPDCRIISYDVLIDGTAGTATVRACDKGEPGRNDTFDIVLSNGYHAGSDLGMNHPGGGNIQLHKCPPGWE